LVGRLERDEEVPHGVRILVDTSVWIDFFRGLKTEKVEKLEGYIRQREDLCSCGFILAEVLQGIREEKDFVTTKRRFGDMIYLADDRATFELGAGIYQELRRKVTTIRNSIDCLIAAIVVQNGVHLLENDRDYHFIDRLYPLNRL
jgi:predicted nucleic acid-binding protein